MAALLLAAASAQETAPSHPTTEGSARWFSQRVDGDEILSLASGFFLRRGDLEVEGDFAVLWFDRDAYQREFDRARERRGGLRREPEAPAPRLEPETRPGLFPAPLPEGLLDVAREIYVEGNVRFTQGAESNVRVERLYLDLRTGRGVFVHPVLRTTLTLAGRPRPLVVRAEYLRRDADGSLTGKGARLTTCPFARPHYHVSADELELRGDEKGAVAIAGRGSAIRVGETTALPLPTWSFSQGDRDWFPIRDVRVGSSSRFGAHVTTEWGNDFEAPGAALNRLLGIGGRFDGEWTLELGESLRRGPSADLTVDYRTPGAYRGELKTFAIQDHGEDRGPFADLYAREDPTRGRVRWENRAFLGARGILDVELAYERDPLVLPEFFKREFREEKDPETAVSFREVGDHLAFTALARFRLNDFDAVPPEGVVLGGPPPSLNEALPQAALQAIFLPLPPLPLPGGTGRAAGLPLVPYYSGRVEGANLRKRFADVELLPGVPPFFPAEDVRTTRFDTVHEVDLPFRLGEGTVTPFGAARYTSWSNWLGGTGGTGRFVGEAGARGSVHLERPYGPLRHLLDPAVEYRNAFAATREPSDLLAFDETEAVGKREVLRLAVRNRIASGASLETYGDLLVSVPIFPRADRDNAGRTTGNPAFDLTLAPWGREERERRPVLRAVGEYDRGLDKLGAFDAGLRLPGGGTAEWLLGYAEARDPVAGDLSYAAAAAGAAVHLGEKWDLEGVGQYDFHRDRLLANRVALRRIGHDVIFEIVAFRDRGSGDAGVSFRVQPALLFDRRRPFDRRRSRSFFEDEPAFSGAY
ncbi:MAG TPA: hypothetical protein VFI25_14680 [Planctomycetota bacterium]|nr:hypothetical protein [Planctomycetota bacterium]